MAESPTTPRGTPPGAPFPRTPPAHTAGADDDRSSELRDVERKLSSARARLFTRLDELGRRYTKARDSVDVARMVREHPLAAVGIAFSVGMLAGLPRGKGIGGQVVGLVVGLAASAARSAITDYVLERVRAPGADR